MIVIKNNKRYDFKVLMAVKALIDLVLLNKKKLEGMNE